jgi:hypothetical protein
MPSEATETPAPAFSGTDPDVYGQGPRSGRCPSWANFSASISFVLVMNLNLVCLLIMIIDDLCDFNTMSS